MADTKISALPASTTPLAGTEVLPIVQGGVTKQVSVADLTAGRALSATELTLTTGNLIVANGQGVDFSATPGTGTSELFDDYEEGTFVPQWEASGGGLSVTYSEALGRYTKIGRMVYIQVRLVTTGSTGGTGFLRLGGLPFTSANVTMNPGFIVPTFSYNWPSAAVLTVIGDQNATSFTCYSAYAGTTNTQVGATALAGATVYFIGGGCYEAA